MNIKTRLSILLLLLCHVVPSALAAAEAGKPGEEASLDWYDIELIVFRHHDYKALSKENWARDPGSPMIRSARELLPALPEKLSSAHSDKLKGPIAFIQLNEESYQMQEKFDLLRKSSQYEPLIHLAWRQPGFGPEEAEAVHIHGGVNWQVVDSEAAEESTAAATVAAADTVAVADTVTGDEGVEGPPAPFIDGTIKLIRKRFLHVETDLLYRAPYIEDNDNKLAQAQWPQAFRLQESRRMRSREIHYLDHPMFGVLILATPYEPPQEEAAGDAAAKPAAEQKVKPAPSKSKNPLTGTIRR